MWIDQEAPSGNPKLSPLFLMIALILPSAAHAAWETVPEIGVSMRTDDNPRMRPNFEDSATSADVSIEATLRSFSERGNFYIRPRIVSSTYADAADSDLESNNYFLRTLGEYRWQSATIGFNTNYRNESVVDAELAEVIPEDPDVPDPIDSETGRLVFLDEDRKQFTVNPFVEFNLSERSALRVGSRYIDTAYSGVAGLDIGRTDFTQTQFELGLVRNVDERNEVTAQVFASEYEADATQNTTDTVGVEGMFTRVLSPSWNMNLTAGLQRHDYVIIRDGVVLDNAATNFAFDVGFRKRTEVATLNLNVRKIVTPSGTGYLIDRDEISLYVRRQTSERVALFGGLRLSQISAVDNTDRIADRDYTRADLGVEWAVARQMFLRFAYDYTFQEFAAELDSDARSNQFMIGFGYRGLSRQ